MNLKELTTVAMARGEARLGTRSSLSFGIMKMFLKSPKMSLPFKYLSFVGKLLLKITYKMV